LPHGGRLGGRLAQPWLARWGCMSSGAIAWLSGGASNAVSGSPDRAEAAGFALAEATVVFRLRASAGGRVLACIARRVIIAEHTFAALQKAPQAS